MRPCLISAARKVRKLDSSPFLQKPAGSKYPRGGIAPIWTAGSKDGFGVSVPATPSLPPLVRLPAPAAAATAAPVFVAALAAAPAFVAAAAAAAADTGSARRAEAAFLPELASTAAASVAAPRQATGTPRTSAPDAMP